MDPEGRALFLRLHKGTGRRYQIKEGLYFIILDQLKKKFGHEQAEKILRKYKIAGNIEALTEGEGRYILSFAWIDAIRDRISKEGYERSRKDSEGPI